MGIKRRFIAGARCPKCQAMDRVVMLSDIQQDAEWIECIECGYSENRPTHIEASVEEVPDHVGVIQFKPRPH